MLTRKTFFSVAVLFAGLVWFGHQAKAAPETRRVYRLYSASLHHDHMSSFSETEGSQWGYHAESSVLLYSQPYGGSGGQAHLPVLHLGVGPHDHHQCQL